MARRLEEMPDADVEAMLEEVQGEKERLARLEVQRRSGGGGAP